MKFSIHRDKKDCAIPSSALTVAGFKREKELRPEDPHRPPQFPFPRENRHGQRGGGGGANLFVAVNAGI